MPNWEEIRSEWETTKVTFKALAEKHDVKDSTIRSRKNREKWSRGNVKRNATNATQRKQNVATKKKEFEPVVVSDDLNDKQRLFCIYYIKYFNATKAYQKAYECAYTTAMSNGYSLLRNTKITSVIERMKQEQTNELMLDVKDVLQKYIDIAFADIGDYVRSDDGYLITLNPLEEVDTSIVSEISNTENGPKIKLADKMKALDMLARYTDLLSDNDKKRLEEEKIKTDITKVNVEISKLKGDDLTEYESDGFEDAILGLKDVWADE